jgi:hypothetical protein
MRVFPRKTNVSSQLISPAAKLELVSEFTTLYISVATQLRNALSTSQMNAVMAFTRHTFQYWMP